MRDFVAQSHPLNRRIDGCSNINTAEPLERAMVVIEMNPRRLALVGAGVHATGSLSRKSRQNWRVGLQSGRNTPMTITKMNAGVF